MTRGQAPRYAVAVPPRQLAALRKPASLRSLAAFASLLSLLALPAVAQAAEETATINFDDLPSLTRVTNQYEATKGILFASPFEYGFADSEPGNGSADAAAFCGAPYTREDSMTSSPPNEAVFSCGGGEFPIAGTFAVLTNYARKVSAKVGDPELPGSNTFRLDAYNVEKELIGSAEATSLTQEINTPISFEAPGGKYEIAYFALYRRIPQNDESFLVGMDDIELITDSAQAPAISIAASVGGRLPQGTKSERQVSIVRHNHSEGPVELKAQGLPSGVSASFNPAILNSTETKSTLTLAVAENAPTAETTGVLEALPKVVKAGTATSTVPVTLAVVAPFNVYVGLASSIPASTTITAPPCSTAAVGVRTTIEAPFSSPVSLALSTSGETPDVSSLTLEKTVLEPSDFNLSGVNEQTLRITRNGNGASAGSFNVYVLGTSGSFFEPAATVIVTRGAPVVSSISTSSGRTPQALQAGTPVTISGSGFCPGTTVQFGNSKAVATPSINSNGTQLTMNVPRLATSGPVSVTSGGASASAPTPMTIDSYRNVNGYPFHNYLPSIDFEQLTDAFGEDQTYDTIDLCWPFGCNIHFRDPMAMILNAIANASLDSGACFGISLSSQRFLEGDRSLSEFPPGSASNIFGLEGQGGPSGQLTNFINAMHVSQLSTEFLSHWLTTSTSQGTAGGVSMSKSVFEEIQSVLNSGRHPLVALQEGGTGHVVVAYDLEGAPGDYYIDVYDSNDPFGQGGDENSTDGSHHQQNWETSRIHVGSDGEWTLPSTGISGGVTGLVVTDPASLPTHPTMPTGLGLLKAIGGGLFGSAGPGSTTGAGHMAPPPSTVTQLSDSAGHTLFAANGALNTNPATRLAAAPFSPLVGARAHSAANDAQPPIILLPPGVGALKATITGTGTGPDTHTLIGHGFAGQIDTQASNGVKDTLALLPGGGQVGFSTAAAHKPLTLTLIGAASKERRTAQISTTSFGGPGDVLAFTGGQSGLAFTHHGAATTFSLTLSGLGPRSAPSVFQSGPLHITAGATARIGAIRWSALAGSTLRIRIGGRTLVVHNHAHAAHLASIGSLRAKKGRGGAVSLSIAAALHQLPAGAQVAFAWTVHSGRRVVATHATLAHFQTGSRCYVHGICVRPGAPSSASYTFTFKPKRKGRYSLTGTVTVVTIQGVTQSASRASRTLSFKV